MNLLNKFFKQGYVTICLSPSSSRLWAFSSECWANPPHHWLKSVSVNLLWLYPKDQRLGALEQRLLYRGNLMFTPFYNTAHHYKEFLSVLRVFTFKSKSNLYNSDYQAAKVLQVNCSNKGNSV